MTIRRNITYDAALIKAESLCARAEYSSEEMLRRIMGWGLSRAQAQTIVDHLVDHEFIDDHRFAMAYTRQQAVYARWGQRKIAMSLRQKGVASPDISEALESVDPEQWAVSATELARLRAKAMGCIDYQAKVKIYRTLAARGFDAATINVALKQLGNDEADEEVD